jgi:hypothetical protein
MYFKISVSIALILIIGLGFWLDWGLEPVSEINELKTKSEEDFSEKRFREAFEALKRLSSINKDEQTDEAAQLNKGHSLFNLKDTSAKFEYAKMNFAKEKSLRSIALQQNAVLLANFLRDNPGNEKGKEMLEEAIALSREALRANPANDDARYNYELLVRLQSANSQNQQSGSDNQNSEQKEQKEEENKQQQQKEQEGKGKNEEKEGKKNESASEHTEKRKMDKEAAQMILNAMKNSETQYLQQMKRKAAKPHDKGLPDW